jgi:hypothetical protein
MVITGVLLGLGLKEERGEELGVIMASMAGA